MRIANSLRLDGLLLIELAVGESRIYHRGHYLRWTVYLLMELMSLQPQSHRSRWRSWNCFALLEV